MDQGAHLVADSLDAVLAAAAVGQGRALVGFERGDLRLRKRRLDPVAGGEGSGASGRRSEAGDPAVADALHGLDAGIARDVAVEAVVRHQLELRERVVLRILLEFIRALQGQDHVGLGAGREVEPRAVLPDPLVAFLRHVVGHDHDRVVLHQVADVGHADPEVAGRRSEDRMPAGQDRPVDATLDQRRIGRTDLVRTGREGRPEQDDDVRLDPRERLRQDDLVHFVLAVLPCDVEKIDRVELVLAFRRERPLPDRLAGLLRVKHLRVGRTERNLVHRTHPLSFFLSI